MTKRLFLMRHAKSSWADLGQDDFDRPLNDRGVRDAPRMGRWMASQNLMPDLILASSAKRTLETARLFSEGANYQGEILSIKGLYLCDVTAFIEEISRLKRDPQALLVIAHNPGTASLIFHLSGERLEVTTGNIASIQVEIDSWSDFNRATKGSLQGFWQPKTIQLK